MKQIFVFLFVVAVAEICNSVSVTQPAVEDQSVTDNEVRAVRRGKHDTADDTISKLPEVTTEYNDEQSIPPRRSKTRPKRSPSRQKQVVSEEADSEEILMPNPFSDLTSFLGFLSRINSADIPKLQTKLKQVARENPTLKPLLDGLQGLLQNKEMLNILKILPKNADGSEPGNLLQTPLKYGNFIIEPVSNFLQQALYVTMMKAGSVVKGAGDTADAAFDNAKDFIDSLQASNSPLKIIPGIGAVLDTSTPQGKVLGTFLDTGHELIGGTAERLGARLNLSGKIGQRAAEATRRSRTRYSNGTNFSTTL